MDFGSIVYCGPKGSKVTLSIHNTNDTDRAGNDRKKAVGHLSVLDPSRIKRCVARDQKVSPDCKQNAGNQFRPAA